MAHIYNIVKKSVALEIAWKFAKYLYRFGKPPIIIIIIILLPRIQWPVTAGIYCQTSIHNT